VGTSGMRPRTRELRKGTTERSFGYEGEDQKEYDNAMALEKSFHFSDHSMAHGRDDDDGCGGGGSWVSVGSPIGSSGSPGQLIPLGPIGSVGSPGQGVPQGVSQGRLSDKPNAYGAFKPFFPYGMRDAAPMSTGGSNPGTAETGVSASAGAGDKHARLGSNLEDSSMEGFKGMFSAECEGGGSTTLALAGADAGAGAGAGAMVGAGPPGSPMRDPTRGAVRTPKARTGSRGGGSRGRSGGVGGGALTSPVTPGTGATRGLTSRELGKTTRIPKTGSSGIRPIRVSGRHRDSGSGGHLLYLRVSTPDDPEGARPYSLLDIAKDHDKALKDEKEYRQSEEYIMRKEEIFREIAIKGPLGASKGALRPAPPSFWETWRKKNHSRYPNGIDNTEGCTSTAGTSHIFVPTPLFMTLTFSPNFLANTQHTIHIIHNTLTVDPRALGNGGYDTSFLAMVRLEKELGIQNYKEPPNKVTTPAEAFVMRRREARVRRTIAERAVQTDSADRAMEDFAKMAGLKHNESLGSGLTNKRGLTHQISSNERKADFQAKKVVVH